jgi:hypothetical protein
MPTFTILVYGKMASCCMWLQLPGKTGMFKIIEYQFVAPMIFDGYGSSNSLTLKPFELPGKTR